MSEEERCELDEYAESIVSLTFAEDIEGGELRDMIDNRYHELEAYVNFLESFYNYASYGPNYYEVTNSQLLPNHRERLKYVHLKVYARISEILYSACANHFHQEFAYVYKREDNSFTFLENLSVNSDRCLCSNANERGSCGYAGIRRKAVRTLKFKAGRDRPVKFLRVDKRTGPNGNIRLSQHHIIPMALIARFFRVWMKSDKSTPGRSLRVNDCVNILNSRIKRSVKKVMVHKIKKMNEAASGYMVNHDISDVVNDSYFEKFFESLFAHSAGGDTFVGPSGRGPLDPSFGTLGDGVLTAFEVDCKPLIGTQRYREMFSLYQRLLKFVHEAPRATAFDRLRTGAELFVSMMMTLQKYDITPMNENQWEERELTSVEMSMINWRLRSIYRGKKFWSIKNSFTRPSRSLPQLVDRCYSRETFAHNRWNDFVTDLMESLLQAYSLEKSPSWSCILNRLYFDFKFSSQKNSGGIDCSDSNFESHLYTIISRTQDWHDCINHYDDGSSEPEDWCSAWRRIMFNSDVGSGNYRNNDTRPLHFHRDSEILMKWLLKQVAKSDANESSLAFSGQTGLDNSVCSSFMNNTSLSCPNHCGSSDREEGYLTEKDKYEQKWYVGEDGKLKCWCPTDVKIVLTHKNKELYVSYYACDKNSPLRNAPRCEDFR